MNAQEISTMLQDKVTDLKVQGDRRIFAETTPEKYRKVLSFLKSKNITHLSTITGVDLGEQIGVMYHLDCGDGVIFSLRVAVPSKNPKLKTVTDIFPGATLYERDLMEMLGVKIENHPNPKRLFLPDDWPEGEYPLRKESP